MKQKAAAGLLLAGILCVFAVSALPDARPVEVSGSADPAGTQETASAHLSDYISEGDNVITALSGAEQPEALIPFAVGDRYALADQNAVPVTDAVYDRVKLLTTSSGTLWALYEGNTVTAVSPNGELIFPPASGKLRVWDDQYLALTRTDGTTELYQTDGTRLTVLDGRPHSCEDGVLVSKNTDGSWSLTDTDSWETILVPNVRRIGAFSGGTALVKQDAGRWGVIDTDGQITIFPGVIHLWDSRGGYFLAKHAGGTYGVLNADGETVLPFTNTRAAVCSEDLPIYQLWSADGTCTVRNVQSKQSIRLPGGFDGQKLTAWPNHYFSFTAQSGEVLLFDDLGTMEFPAGTTLTELTDSLLIAGDAAGVSVVNLEQAITSKAVDGCYTASDGLADPDGASLVLTDAQTGLAGICGTDGKMVLDMEYEWIRPTGGGLFSVQTDGSCGLVDARGEWVLRLTAAD